MKRVNPIIVKHASLYRICHKYKNVSQNIKTEVIKYVRHELKQTQPFIYWLIPIVFNQGKSIVFNVHVQLSFIFLPSSVSTERTTQKN